MALLMGTKAHPVAATAGALGGIIAMPFCVAGTAVVGTLGTVAVAVPTLGLGAIPGALLTAGATVTTAVTSPFAVGAKIYNGLVPSEDKYKSLSSQLLEELTENVTDKVTGLF